MSNPYEAPQAAGGPPSGSTPGDFDIGVTFQDAFDALSNNGISFLMVLVAAFFAYVVAIMLCILPVFLVLPVLVVGMTQFSLKAVKGDAEFDDFSEAFGRFGELFAPTWGLMLMVFAVSLPGTFVATILQQVPPLVTDDFAVIGLAWLFGQLVTMAWYWLVVFRFQPAYYLYVDRGVGPVDAMSQAWTMTSAVWPKMALMGFACTLLPIVGVFACFVGVIPAMMVVYLAQASMYRQLVGER